MTIPRTTDIGYEYTEFDGKSLEWWQARRKKTAAAIEQDIKPEARAMLAALLPDETMHAHVARVGQSEQGSTTLLTTSGHIIQFQGRPGAVRRQGNQIGALVSSRDIDHKGVALVMSYYERYGQKVGPDQIPFGKTASDEFKDRIRSMWSEIKAQQEPGSARPAAAPTPKTRTPGVQPAFA